MPSIRRSDAGWPSWIAVKAFPVPFPAPAFMSSYIVSPRADEDIFEVWRYLYERAGVEIANRVESELYNAFELLSQNPRIGHQRSDLTSHSVLFLTVYSYMIVYRPNTPLEIARVLHGKRDLRRILRTQP